MHLPRSEGNAGTAATDALSHRTRGPQAMVAHTRTAPRDFSGAAGTSSRVHQFPCRHTRSRSRTLDRSQLLARTFDPLKRSALLIRLEKRQAETCFPDEI